MIERARLQRRIDGGSYFGSPKSDVAFIHTGSKLLDLALGGGWAEERVSNIIGDKSTGKTLLCIEAAANFARKYSNGRIKYREAEAAFLPDYAAALGMPIKRVDFGKKVLETVEDLYEDLDQTIASARREPTLYILDSLDALSDREEMDRDIDEGSYGAKKAKTLSQTFRRLTKPLQDARMTLMIVSQVRDAIGVRVGPKTRRSGGRALDFYSSQTVTLTQLGQVKKTIRGVERVTGIDILARVTKNKIGLPFREAEFAIMFGYGIDDLMACCEYLKDTKGLDSAGVPADYRPYVRDLVTRDDRVGAARIYQTVERQWYEIERSFLPRRRKYV